MKAIKKSQKELTSYKTTMSAHSVVSKSIGGYIYPKTLVLFDSPYHQLSVEPLTTVASAVFTVLWLS